MKIKSVLKAAVATRLLPMFLILAVPAVVQAQFNFTTNNDGSLNITGYTGSGNQVTIPDTLNGLPLTGVGSYAFYSSSVASITFGTNVASIGLNAFNGCNNLTNVALGSSVTSIGINAFYGCTNLASVIIPGSVTNIGSFAFFNCTSLTMIMVEPDNLTYSSVNGVLFNKDQATLISCPGGLTGAYMIPNSVTNIGDQAFESSLLTNIMIPSSVIVIGQGAFADCTNLSRISIPGSVTAIGFYSFSGCTALTSVNISNGVISIGGGAFAGCTSLVNVTIPGSVISIGSNAFAYCSRLAGVYFQGNAPATDSTVFAGDSVLTIYNLPGATGWNPTLAGVSVVLWNPQAQTGDGSFGIQNYQFGFNVTGSSNLLVIVEGCTDLANPIWTPVGTNILVGGWSYFSDPQWTNYPGRFYRLRSP
jgi:hypothetical protein